MMLTRNPLPLLGLIGALALAGCNQGDDAANNLAVNNIVDANTLAVDDGAVIESEEAADDDAVDVADPPSPPANAPAAEAAPLTEAEAIEEEIARGAGIKRVRYGEGWAWTRGDRILRTADNAGSNVEYFRSGENRPFFVQRGERAWAYDQGRVTREYDRQGRATRPDDSRRREAEEAERGARERRDQAERARDRAPRRDDVRPGRPTPPPIATPSQSPTPRGRDREDRRDRADTRPTPRPTATATARPGREQSRGEGERGDRERRDDRRSGE